MQRKAMDGSHGAEEEKRNSGEVVEGAKAASESALTIRLDDICAAATAVMAPLKASSLFVLSALVALLGTTTSAPHTRRPSRGDRTVPSDALQQVNVEIDPLEEEPKGNLRRERAAVVTNAAGGSGAGAIAPGTGGAGADGAAAQVSGLGLLPRRRRKSPHARRSATAKVASTTAKEGSTTTKEGTSTHKRKALPVTKEGVSPAPSTGKQPNSNEEVDYYYYYFDSFEEGVTDGVDFDDSKDATRKEGSEGKGDGASVMELLTMATWHKSQNTE